MCLIVHRDAGSGAHIPNEILAHNLHTNPDGFGIGWRDEAGLHYDKFAPGSATNFEALFRQIDRKTKHEYVAHFRLATHGPACLDLAHPFEYTDEVEGKVLVFHNGVLPFSQYELPEGESDTSFFVKSVLAKLPSRWWDQPALKFLVTEFLDGDRMVLMTPTRTVNIDPKAGKQDGGLWYSSHWYKPWKASLITVNGATVKWGSNTKLHASTCRCSSCVRDITVSDARDSWTKFAGDADARVDAKWSHLGHACTTVAGAERTKNGDYIRAVICDICKTVGDYYIIEGKVYINMSHNESLLAGDEDYEPIREVVHA